MKKCLKTLSLLCLILIIGTGSAFATSPEPKGYDCGACGVGSVVGLSREVHEKQPGSVSCSKTGCTIYTYNVYRVKNGTCNNCSYVSNTKTFLRSYTDHSVDHR